MNNNNSKILIVDDDTLVTYTLSTLLAARGYTVITENDSKNALDLALKELPDLICLDLMMPPPDGFKLTRMMRELPALNATPILIVTAMDDGNTKAVAFDAGATDYLKKPFQTRDLYEKIQDLLHGKELGLFNPD